MTAPSSNYILVVEDDPFYANIYRTKLEKEGIAAIVVNDGNAALKTMRERRPILVVLDLIMTGKDGFETLAEIKADPALKEVTVIVLSNLSQDEDIKRVMDLGAAEYHIKAEISIEELMGIIKQRLI